jgi:hypothetical protein
LVVAWFEMEEGAGIGRAPRLGAKLWVNRFSASLLPR